MAKILATAAGVLAVLAALFLIVPGTGAIDVAATGGHLPGVEWFLSTARESSIHARAQRVTVPSSLQTEDRLRSGLVHYHEMCVTCHGAPGVEPSEIGKGLNPSPPSLHGEEAEEHGPAETFWVAKHGIRMTGMPAFGVTHSDEELWDITALVGKLPEMEASEYTMKVREAGLELRAGHSHAGAGAHPHGEAGSEEEQGLPETDASGETPPEEHPHDHSEHEHSEHEHGS